MRVSVCVLVCVLSVCSALICPDGGMCDDGNTCCQAPWGGYGCCPLPNAECCSDHLHCCHEGTLCDMEHGKCVNKTHALDWVRRVASKQISLPQAIVCPDQESECPDETTCCEMPDGTWGCCPMPNAVCCEDKRHCCPSGTVCDLAHSKCVTSTLGPTPLLRKFPAIRVRGQKDAAVMKMPVTSPDSDDVICPDKVSMCPEDTTCCKLANGSYGCCPMPNAVCCSDYVHCCPEGTTCNLEHGSCDLPSELSVAPPILLTVDSVPCNDTVACSTGYTCCKKQDGEWGCCPLPEAVCCEDHIHCCPQDTECNLSEGTCDDRVDPSFSVPLVTKVPAFPRPSRTASQKCDPTFSCPQDTTCCKMDSGKWGCCPLPHAVCCEDHLHCCPHDTVCNVAAGTCDGGPGAGSTVPWLSKTPAVALVSKNSQGNPQIPWLKKQPAKVTSGLGDVQCDDTTSCAAGMTCCKLGTGKWGCCPLVKAVCCEDQEHCCPHDYTCDLQSGTCIKPSAAAATAAPVHTHSDREDEVRCDAVTRCSKSQTCCRISDSEWSCCPFDQAVCCKDMKHCCPKGYTCDPEKRCTKASPLTWWDDSL